MRRFLLTVLLLFLVPAINLYAQSDENPPVITGHLIDPSGESLPYASIALHDSSGSGDNTLQYGTTSDSAGYFRLKGAPGNYNLRISYLSFKPLEKEVSLEPGDQMQLGTITMSPDSATMGEVIVRGQQSQLELNFDKRVFSVGTDLTSMGGNVLDVLSKVPSLSVDIEGNLSLRGSENVRVLVNGKESNLVSRGTDGLSSIPAHMIKEVEVITNPSARYDASGEAGIVNIILKKNRNRGVNGSVSANTGYPGEHGVSTNLNYKKGNINWFLNGGLEYEKDPGEGSRYQRYNSPDTSYSYRQSEDSEQTEYEGDLRLGADIHLPKDQLLTASASLSMEFNEEQTDVTYRDMSNGNVFRQVYRNDYTEASEQNYEVELEYENKFPGHEDHKLTAVAQYDNEEESEQSEIKETVQQGSQNPTQQQSDNDQTEGDMLLKADYVYPHNDKFRLETGFKSTLRWLENDYTVSELQDGTWVTLPNYNENFNYDENINAAYGIVAYETGPWSAQMGLRAEQANIETQLEVSGDKTSKTYVDLFPSANLSYEFNDQQSVQVSYSRRISRPNHWHLLPFYDYTDSRNQFRGNPNLDPEYSNSYEFTFMQYWEGGSLLSSLYYRYRLGVIERIQTVIDGATHTLPINMATEKNWGIEVTASQDFDFGLSLNGSANYFRANTEGSYQDNNLSRLTTMLFGRLGIQWKFMEGWQTESSLRYRGSHKTTQGEQKAMNTVDFALAREFLDGNAKLSLNIRDVFNTQKHVSIIDEQYLYSRNEFRWRTRTAELTFTYRFNQDDRQRRGDRGGPPGDFEGGGPGGPGM